MNAEQSQESALMAQLNGMRAMVEADALEAERERALTRRVVAALRDGPLLSMCLPRELGGAESTMQTQLSVFEAAARIDGSFGWCVMIAALQNAMAGSALPDVGARAVFGGSGAPIIAGLITPSGVATPVEDGYVIRGRWAFGSGIRHADWVVATCVIEGRVHESGFPLAITALLPIAEVVVEDTWAVAGLRATGSEHYRVEGKHVPHARAFPFAMARAQRGGPWFDLPLIAMLNAGHAGVALGIAERALDELLRCAPARMRLWSRTIQSEHPGFRMSLGAMRAKLSAARMYALDGLQRTERAVHEGRALDTDEWVATRTAVTYATDVAVEVASYAFRHAGSAALFEHHPLQRCLRDIYAVAQHVAATDDAYEFGGQALLGDVAFNPLLLPREERAGATP